MWSIVKVRMMILIEIGLRRKEIGLLVVVDLGGLGLRSNPNLIKIDIVISKIGQ